MFTSPVFFVASAFFVPSVVLAVLAGVAAGALLLSAGAIALLSVVVVFEGTIVLLLSDGVTTGEGVTFSSVFLLLTTTVAIAVGENFVNVATTFPSAPFLVGNTTHCPSWKWRTWIPSVYS